MFLQRQFIFPTNLGGYLNGLIFLLMLLAFGYNNNLLLIFTLILFGMNLVWVIQSHLFFKKMTFLDLSVKDAFQGQVQELRIRWRNENDFGDWEVEIVRGKERYKVSSVVTKNETLVGEFLLPSRGHYSFSRLRISSPSPFGLYRNWIILPIKCEAFVYPALRKGYRSSPQVATQSTGNLARDPHVYEEFIEFRSSEAELSSRISWKHYARTGEILVKHGEGVRGETRSLNLPAGLSGEAKERALSDLATEIQECALTGQEFELKLPGSILGPGGGPSFIKSTLRELARC